jgi:hypothetical protein
MSPLSFFVFGIVFWCAGMAALSASLGGQRGFARLRSSARRVARFGSTQGSLVFFAIYAAGVCLPVFLVPALGTDLATVGAKLGLFVAGAPIMLDWVSNARAMRVRER